MKQLFIIAVALSMSFIARASDDEAAVRKLEQSWFAAIAKADIAGMNALRYKTRGWRWGRNADVEECSKPIVSDEIHDCVAAGTAGRTALLFGGVAFRRTHEFRNRVFGPASQER